MSMAAKLVGDATPRLRASPAIDAADTNTLGLGIIINGLPVTDADGLRRIKGATNKIDIGAYESGDVSFAHTGDRGEHQRSRHHPRTTLPQRLRRRRIRR
jgi:hypothetical protein